MNSMMDKGQGLYSRANLAMMRVKKDMQELVNQRLSCSCGSASTAIEFPDGNKNLLKIKVTVSMSAGCYRGGTYSFMLDIPPAYPFRAPEVTCTARIWHPNIDTGNGRVELDILNKDWRPVLSINTVVFALQVSGRDSAAVEASGTRRSAEPSVHALGGGGGLCKSLPKHFRETPHGATRTPNKSRQSPMNPQRFSTTYHTPVAALSRAEPRQRDQQRRRAHPAHRPGIVREPGAADPPRRFLLRTCVRTERRPQQRRGQPADAAQGDEAQVVLGRRWSG